MVVDIPLIEPATEEDLEQISEDLHLGVGEEQLEDYLGKFKLCMFICTNVHVVKGLTMFVGVVAFRYQHRTTHI